MTDTEKSALEARIDELCAENERLRNQLHDQQDTAEHNFVRNAHEYKRVCDENAKLRELAQGLRHCSQLRDCEDCPLYDLTEPEHCRSARLEKALGIEVPE